MILGDEYLTMALEADLQQEYGLDIARFHRREIGYRRFVTLVCMLGEETRVNRALAGRPTGVTHTDTLLVGLINQLRIFEYHWACSKVEKGKRRPKAPDLIDMPEPVELDQSTRDIITAEEKRRKASKHKFATMRELRDFLGSAAR